MKKVITIVMIAMTLLLTVPAYADGLIVDDFMGMWVNYYDTNSNGATIEAIYLRDDHTVFYMNRRFNASDAGFGREFVGSWEVNGDCIHIKYGDSAESDLYMSDGFLLIPLGGDQYITYGKVPVWGKVDAPQASGVAVPQGEYVIGEDIPAGRYTVDAGDAKRVTVWVYRPNGMSDYYYIGSKENEQTMTANLQDGGKLRIEGATVYLSALAGLGF